MPTPEKLGSLAAQVLRLSEGEPNNVSVKLAAGLGTMFGRGGAAAMFGRRAGGAATTATRSPAARRGITGALFGSKTRTGATLGLGALGAHLGVDAARMGTTDPSELRSKIIFEPALADVKKRRATGNFPMKTWTGKDITPGGPADYLAKPKSPGLLQWLGSPMRTWRASDETTPTQRATTEMPTRSSSRINQQTGLPIEETTEGVETVASPEQNWREQVLEARKERRQQELDAMHQRFAREGEQFGAYQGREIGEVSQERDQLQQLIEGLGGDPDIAMRDTPTLAPPTSESEATRFQGQIEQPTGYATSSPEQGPATTVQEIVAEGGPDVQRKLQIRSATLMGIVAAGSQMGGDARGMNLAMRHRNTDEYQAAAQELQLLQQLQGSAGGGGEQPQTSAGASTPAPWGPIIIRRDHRPENEVRYTPYQMNRTFRGYQ